MLAANFPFDIVLHRTQAIAKALAAFNGDPDVAVMLMPAKTAAAGLTLTAASRVILLEPAADPAIPQQVSCSDVCNCVRFLR